MVMCFTGSTPYDLQGSSAKTSSITKELQCLPVDVLSIFDSSKENNASKCIAEKEEKHAHDDEEALVHADYHSQQQHLQRHLNT